MTLGTRAGKWAPRDAKRDYRPTRCRIAVSPFGGTLRGRRFHSKKVHVRSHESICSGVSSRWSVTGSTRRLNVWPHPAEPGIQGLPFENPEEYIKRSPIYHVQNLQVPILVHVATNDCDVYFREDQQMVYTLRALKPDLAETKIYVDPPYRRDMGGCGHTFSRRVDPTTLERDDTPEQIDSWERTWTFFEWNLRPSR